MYVKSRQWFGFAQSVTFRLFNTPEERVLRKSKKVSYMIIYADLKNILKAELLLCFALTHIRAQHNKQPTRPMAPWLFSFPQGSGLARPDKPGLSNNFSELGTSAVSSANNRALLYLKPANIYTRQFQKFPKHPNIHLSHHAINIYIRQPWRHHTTLSQSNINGNHSLTFIALGHQPYYLHKNSALLSTIFIHLYTLSICHIPLVDQSHHMPFPYP